MPSMRKFCLSLAAIAALISNHAAFAAEDEFGIEHPARTYDDNGIERTKGGEYPGAIHSIDAMQMGETTGSSLSLSARNCLKDGDYDKSIQLSKLAIEKDFDDIDTHMTYAEALEKKYNKQVVKDPALFNKCVKEWLMVLRNEVGHEKGMSWRGMQIPGMQEFYKDEEHAIPARAHIVTLTGHAPRWHETDSAFMKKVGKPDGEEVSGKVVASEGKSVKNTKSEAKPADRKQISIRNGTVTDTKKAGPGNEE